MRFKQMKHRPDKQKNKELRETENIFSYATGGTGIGAW